MNEPSNTEVLVEVSRRVATITLNAPTTRNALSSSLVAELDNAIQFVSQTDCRAIVITHSGPVFCSGLDLKQVSSGSVNLDGLVNIILALRSTRQPTIAVLTGPVRAGGLGIMAACDLVVVSKSVNFAFSEVKIGAVPAVISVPILARVNPSSVTSAFITGEKIDADRALSIGLITHVSDDPHLIASEIIDSICLTGPQAVTKTIALLRRASNENYQSRLAEMCKLSATVFESAEAKEGIAAFLEHRSPVWKT